MSTHLRLCVGCLFAVVAFGMCLVTRLPAQGGGRPAAGAEQPAQTGPQIQVGRLLTNEAKGKLHTITFEETGGETYELKLSPQVEFSVVGPGEMGLIRKGVYVTARGIESNNTVYLTKLTVHVVPRTKRMPPGRVQKLPTVGEGESLNTFDISGEVVATGPAPDYPDHTVLSLKVNPNSPPVWIEPGAQIEVASGNPAHAVVGADLEFITRKVGSRQIPTAVRVQHSGAFTSDELFGAEPAERP